MIKKDSKSTEPGTALVTGGAKRIGASISKHLAKSGWNVIIHFNTNKKAAIQLRSKIIKLGGSAEIIKADLSKEKHVKELIPRIKKKYAQRIFYILWRHRTLALWKQKQRIHH